MIGIEKSLVIVAQDHLFASSARNSNSGRRIGNFTQCSGSRQCGQEGYYPTSTAYTLDKLCNMVEQQELTLQQLLPCISGMRTSYKLMVSFHLVLFISEDA